MTNDGLNRIAELFKDDILKIEYDLDGVTDEITSFDTTVEDKRIILSFLIPPSVVGVVNNIKVVGNTITYDIKNFEITKTSASESELISIPYKFENVEV